MCYFCPIRKLCNASASPLRFDPRIALCSGTYFDRAKFRQRNNLVISGTVAKDVNVSLCLSRSPGRVWCMKDLSTVTSTFVIWTVSKLVNRRRATASQSCKSLSGWFLTVLICETARMVAPRWIMKAADGDGCGRIYPLSARKKMSYMCAHMTTKYLI